jgi:hypothetical protein
MALLASYIVRVVVPLATFEQYTTSCFYLCEQESELYMLNMRERTEVLFKRLSGLSLLRLAGRILLGLLTVQVLTAAVLLVITELFELLMEQWESQPWYIKASERILAPLRFIM